MVVGSLKFGKRDCENKCSALKKAGKAGGQKELLKLHFLGNEGP